MIGIISALLASLSWTFACFIWRKQTQYFSAIEVNLLKNIIAILIFSPIFAFIDWNNNLINIVILITSGIIGIGVGDSLYIKSLKLLGTRLTLTIESISPIIANILGILIINEIPSFNGVLGSIIVTCSIILIIKRRRETNQFNYIKNNLQIGLLYSFLSVFCAVLAASLSRLILINTNIYPIQTTAIRLIGGIIILLPISRFKIIKIFNSINNKIKLNLLIGTIFGTNLGIFLQQIVFQSLPIGVGWTLLSTSPFFSLIFAKQEGEKIDLITIVLLFTTIFGVFLSFL